MSILVINGSARRGGIIDQLTALAASCRANETVDIFNLYDLKIAPCRGCMSCRNTGECALPRDDGHILAAKFREADFVVIGTPTYWSNMSGVVKNMFDRLVYVLVSDGRTGLKPLMKGRCALIITACSAPAIYDALIPEGRGAAKRIGRIMRSGGYKVRSVVASGTKDRDALSGKHKRKIARAMRKK